MWLLGRMTSCRLKSVEHKGRSLDMGKLALGWLPAHLIYKKKGQDR